jgi:NitT/TauT family transport system substrate-binding protein
VGATWIAATVLVLAAGARAEPERVSFLPQWLPQAQFAGYYAAEARGLYARRGLDVTMEPGGPDSPPSEALENGDVELTTLWLSTAIQARAAGTRVVNVAQIVQRSSLLLLARKSSGIAKPGDMNGRKVGVWEGDFLLQPRLFFKRHGLRVHEVPLGSTINIFLRGGTEVNVAMWYNEYHTVLNAGIDPDELETFFFRDHGLDFAEDGIYCLEETLRRRPEVVAAFVQASLDGWQWAFDHPGAAVDLVLERQRAAFVPTNRVHQEWMLARMRDLILDGQGTRPSGVLTRAAYDRVAEALLESGWISQAPPFDAFARTPQP